MTEPTDSDLTREVSRLRAELREAHARIAAVEASRFWKLRNLWWRLRLRASALLRPPAPPVASLAATGDLPSLPSPWPAVPPPLAGPVDVVICVHDALDDVRACLASVEAHSPASARVVIVDDGSGPETRDFLAAWVEGRSALLLRNEAATRYTRAANRGLKATTAPYVVLLNSDAVATPLWLERLVAAVTSDPSGGMAGPLSNAATYQSVPEFAGEDGDWARNPIPGGLSPADFARLLAEDAGPVRPRMPFLNGFCLLLTRRLLDQVGLFDEETFPQGYGEENDLALRARKAGFSLVLADDAFVAHEMSKSYGTQRRKELTDSAGAALCGKHGLAAVQEGEAFLRHGRVLAGTRARAAEVATRHDWRERARSRHAGRKVLFVLPVGDRGGGAGVVLSEARSLLRMGVEASVLNLPRLRAAFERAYPDPRVPLVWAAPGEIPDAARGFDAVVATANPSAAWIAPLARGEKAPVLGYYLQDFEPYFYPEGSDGHRHALASFTVADRLVRFATTAWVKGEVEARVGVACALLGHSFQVDLFRPYRMPAAPEPVRIAAMVRPSSPRRAPEFTLDVLSRVATRFGGRVAVSLFGVDGSDPAWRRIRPAFPHELHGVLDEAALASLFNRTHLFCDLSTYQALGLTAQEAMACGAAAVVPKAGGTAAFAVDGENALVVDTSSAEACAEAVARLVEDTPLRERLAARGLKDVARFHPDRTAARMLDLLFGPG